MVSFKTSMPILLLAVVATTGMPNSFDNISISIFIFLLLASSMRFTQATTLSVISSTCNSKFKFLSIQVASKTTTVTSGFPKHMKSLATTSSTELARSE